MRRQFDIPAERETRLWNKYMSNTYEQLNKPDSTVQDAGLFQGQVLHIGDMGLSFLLSRAARLFFQSCNMFSHSNFLFGTKRVVGYTGVSGSEDGTEICSLTV